MQRKPNAILTATVAKNLLPVVPGLQSSRSLSAEVSHRMALISGCGREEAKCCRLLLVTKLAVHSAKGAFCCPARHKMPGSGFGRKQ